VPARSDFTGCGGASRASTSNASATSGDASSKYRRRPCGRTRSKPPSVSFVRCSLAVEAAIPASLASIDIGRARPSSNASSIADRAG
jgi:hypothetical protein